ncbi:MAG: molybdopterin-binding protein [Neisseria sp.]|nr:molybdopterin-binding protein [Neisseria sp.]
MQFKLIIIGDEILHGSRKDRHFAFFKQLLARYGFKLHSVYCLPDERAVLISAFARSFADGIPAFVTGGIGATPDDHTRQAAAAALNLPLELHSEAAGFIETLTLSLGGSLNDVEHARRLNLAVFPEGSEIVPNPYNGVAGFHIREHYFLPGFPEMSHPMAEWVLHTFYAARFHQSRSEERKVWLEGQPESKLIPIMEAIERDFPNVRTFSLPSVRQTLPGGRIIPAHIEFGLKAESEACAHIESAWQAALDALLQNGISWREQPFDN